MTYRIIKVVLVTIINAFNLYQLRGCTTSHKERNNTAHQDEETGQHLNTTKKQRKDNEPIEPSDYIPMNITYKFPCPEDELPPKAEKTNNGDDYSS